MTRERAAELWRGMAGHLYGRREPWLSAIYVELYPRELEDELREAGVVRDLLVDVEALAELGELGEEEKARHGWRKN